MTDLLEYLINNGISKNNSKYLISHFKEKKYAKKSSVLEMGENNQIICFIKKGLVRGYYINEHGDEVTKCFAKENEWCCVYNLLSNAPSEFYIETLEDSILAEIHIDILKKSLNTIPQLQKLLSNLLSHTLIQKEQRNLQFQRMNAKERYSLFLSENSDLASRVNQEYIASYIGITKTSLSRLKKDL